MPNRMCVCEHGTHAHTLFHCDSACGETNVLLIALVEIFHWRVHVRVHVTAQLACVCVCSWIQSTSIHQPLGRGNASRGCLAVPSQVVGCATTALLYCTDVHVCVYLRYTCISVQRIQLHRYTLHKHGASFERRDVDMNGRLCSIAAVQTTPSSVLWFSDFIFFSFLSSVAPLNLIRCSLRRACIVVHICYDFRWLFVFMPHLKSI